MNALIIGLIIWMDAHFFKRILPKQRAAIDTKLGVGRARAIMSILIVLSVVLMVIGYRTWSTTQLYTPPSLLFPIAMVALVFAVTLMGVGHSKSRLRTKIRHPMLFAIILWGVAHLSMRGDMASVVLFGGMIIWALVSIWLINKQEGAWKPSDVVTSTKGDIRVVAIGIILSIIIMTIHHFIIHR